MDGDAVTVAVGVVVGVEEDDDDDLKIGWGLNAARKFARNGRFVDILI